MEEVEQKKVHRRPLLRRLGPKDLPWILIGILLVGYGVYGIGQWWDHTHKSHTAAQVSKQLNAVVTNSTSSPDETPVDPSLNYKVPADQPRQILMPSIKSSGFLQKVGVDQHGSIAVPGNVHYGGWFVDSVRPGSTGLSIIDGHVQGKYAEGIFKRIVNLKKNDIFQIQYGDLSKKNFKVTDVSSYSIADATNHLFQATPGITNQLKLITCGGEFDRKSQEYQKRVIVTAELTN